MSAPNDAGPEVPKDVQFLPCMSLRDWFAGQALCGLHGNPALNREIDATDVAASCYTIADAMLVARLAESDNAQLLADNARGAAYIEHLKKRIQELGGGE